MGRTGLCNGTGAVLPLREPRFYAFPCATALLAIYCGPRVDPHGQVLDGQPLGGG